MLNSLGLYNKNAKILFLVRCFFGGSERATVSDGGALCGGRAAARRRSASPER